MRDEVCSLASDTLRFVLTDVLFQETLITSHVLFSGKGQKGSANLTL